MLTLTPDLRLRKRQLSTIFGFPWLAAIPALPFRALELLPDSPEGQPAGLRVAAGERREHPEISAIAHRYLAGCRRGQ